MSPSDYEQTKRLMLINYMNGMLGLLFPVLLAVTSINSVTNLTILTFDCIITIEDEVKYIWCSRWGIGKILFLLARYPTFAAIAFTLAYTMIPHESIVHCQNFLATSTWLSVFGMCMAEGILVLRTYAVWDCDKRILVLLLLLFPFFAIPCFVVMEIYLNTVKFHPLPYSNLTGCAPYTASHILFVAYVLIMTLESVILALTLYQFINKFRYSGTPLISTLYRDGVLYFIFIFLVSSLNIVMLTTGPPQLNPINKFQATMHSVLSTRILLHLRQAAAKNCEISERGFSNIEIRSPVIPQSDEVPSRPQRSKRDPEGDGAALRLQHLG